MDKFRYKKSLGQNFMQDKKVLERMVNGISCTSDDLIIEIGPGHGALTKYLVTKGCDVIAFEIDKEVMPYLEKIDSPNLKVIYQDFLKVNIHDYLHKEYKHIYIVANIPYYITTPIIERVISQNINETSMILMVQEEVADRFSASCGEKSYGFITVYLQYFYDIKKLFSVSKSAFYPVPKVDSAVIRLIRKHNNNLLNQEIFFTFVKKAFQFKRKNLRNNLKEYDLDKINNVLMKYNHSIQSRAEDISLDEFIAIYEELFNE